MGGGGPRSLFLAAIAAGLGGDRAIARVVTKIE